MARNLGVNRAEVLKLREKGLTIREIAQRLGCSMNAVRYHLYPKERECVRRSYEKRRGTKKYHDWYREYYMKHYHSDPECRAKVKSELSGSGCAS